MRNLSRPPTRISVKVILLAGLLVACGPSLRGGELVVGPSTARAIPTISSVSSASLNRSERFVISGSGFGTTRGSGVVRIGGAPTPVALWSDTEIHAYVLGAMGLGSTSIDVVTETGTSNGVAAVINSLAPPDGHVLWRFQVDSSFILHRPGVAPDGTIYVNDIGGYLYALSPEGGLKWIFDSGGNGGEGPVSVAPDGTVYFASNPLGFMVEFYALRPDGSVLWVFEDQTQETIAGPSVGPDGNIYAVTDFGGIGAFSLTPAGNLRWSLAGFSDFSGSGVEIAFGADQLYIVVDGFFEGISFSGVSQFSLDLGGQTLQPATSPSGQIHVETALAGEGTRLRGYDSLGSEAWSFFSPPSSSLTAPDVGSDGVVYVVHNHSQLNAINPDGTQAWAVNVGSDLGGSPYFGPVVSDDDSALLAGGVVAPGGLGLIQSFDSSNGNLRFQIDLPEENGGRVVPFARPMFAPSGAAYVGTTVLGAGPNDDYSYLYAVDVVTPVPEPTTYALFAAGIPTLMLFSRLRRREQTLRSHRGGR